MNKITKEDLKVVMQPRFVNAIPDEAIDWINDLISDPDMGESYHENMVTYQSVLLEGRYKTESYLNAVKYCTHIVRGDTQKDSYAITFPNRLKEWDLQSKPAKERASIISGYHRTQLVQKILSQAMIPVWLTNQDTYQEAVNTQAELMRYSKSDMVRHLAAKNLLETLARPTEAKISIDINQKENVFMKELKDSVEDLVIAQKKAIESGAMSVKDIAESTIKIGITDAEHS